MTQGPFYDGQNDDVNLTTGFTTTVQFDDKLFDDGAYSTTVFLMTFIIRRPTFRRPGIYDDRLFDDEAFTITVYLMTGN